YTRAIDLNSTAGYFLNNLVKGGSLDVSSTTAYIFNNIFYDSTSECINFNSGTHYVYNNTVVNCASYGFNKQSNTVIIKNNIVSNTGAAAFRSVSGGYHATSTNNLSSSATVPGLNPVTSATVAFVNAAGKDFRLSLTDTWAKGAGANLFYDDVLP